MTDQHPITPPSGLLQFWFEQHDDYNKGINELLIEAARYGADQELEACCEWLREAKNHGLGYEYGQELADRYRAARRPKPSSLKEQALDDLHIAFDRGCLSERQADTIRRALEQIDD